MPDAEGELYVVLEENPFYATGGGQIADVGWITSDRGQLEVVDSVPAGDYQVLRAKIERGNFEVGDAVTASINRVRRQQIEANHTATHILHWALRTVLGQDVVQAGSYVGPDRLRFDYRYTGKVGEDELRRIQELSLQKITENQPVRYYNTTLEEARNLGAIMLFGEKYGELVRVVEVDGFSRELCGGTHVRGTAEIGAFKIVSNRKHGADLYRIEVITGREALEYLTEAAEKAEEAADALRVDLDRLPVAVAGLRDEVGRAREAAREDTLRQGLGEVSELVENAESVDGAKVVTGQVVAADVKGLRQISDDVKNRIGGSRGRGPCRRSRRQGRPRRQPAPRGLAEDQSRRHRQGGLQRARRRRWRRAYDGPGRGRQPRGHPRSPEQGARDPEPAARRPRGVDPVFYTRPWAYRLRSTSERCAPASPSRTPPRR